MRYCRLCNKIVSISRTGYQGWRGQVIGWDGCQHCHRTQDIVDLPWLPARTNETKGEQ